MHACGHDVHSSILLGTAIIVNKLKYNLKEQLNFFSTQKKNYQVARH